ncbi:MAG: hypothetical protein V4532_19335 [Pseudomonadota bacterium]
MFSEIVKNLSTEQIDKLEQLGVARARVSEWRKGKGIPSRKAVLLLAQVSGQNPMELEAEIMLMEAAPEQRATFRQMIKAAGVAASIAIITIAGTILPSDANATPHIQGVDKGALYIM